MAAFHVGRQAGPCALPPLPASPARTLRLPARGGAEAARRTPFTVRSTGRAVVSPRTGEPGTARSHRGTAPAATAAGRGGYARTCADKYGSPRLRSPGAQRFHGFATGESVRAVPPTGRTAGAGTGRVAVRVTGSSNVRTRHGIVQGIHHRRFRLLQRAGGHAYTTQKEAGATSPGLQAGVTVPHSR